MTGDPGSGPTDRSLSPVRQAAFRLLALRDRSSGELAARLAARFPEEQVMQVVHGLEADGYLDDARLARHLADRLAVEKGFGPARVKAELRRRKLPLEPAAEVLAEQAAPDTLQAAARQAARRYLRTPPASVDDRLLRRMSGYLARRGFPDGSIRDIVTTVRQGRLWDEV